MDDKMVVEKIIETIKEHPVLYDSTQPARNHLKESIWQEIANMYDVDVHILKMKWKNLRDCYKKHIRAQTEDSKIVASYKYWQWSAYLDFLRPHIRGTNTEMINCEEYDDVNNFKDDALNTTTHIKLEDHTNSDSDRETIEYVTQKPKLMKKRRKHKSINFAADSDSIGYIEQSNKLIKRQKIQYTNDQNEANQEVDNRTDINDFDGIELIFLGYAKTIMNMPLKRQISVKMKVAKIMMEEEMKCLE